jgi:hypothetical protein
VVGVWYAMNRDPGKTKIAIVETSRYHDVAVPLPQSAECKLKVTFM